MPHSQAGHYRTCAQRRARFKSHPYYLARVIPGAVLEGMEGAHPVDADYDPLHETGTFRTVGDAVELTIRRAHFADANWSLRLLPADVLLAPGDDQY